MKHLFTPILLGLTTFLSAQVRVEVNGLLDLALSKVSEDVHFPYQGVHHDYTDWRFGPSEANLLLRVEAGKHWRLNTRLQAARREGGRFDQLEVPLLNLEWRAEDGRTTLSLGRFLNPFGRFNEQQLATERPFVEPPITHRYSTRVSNVFGAIHFTDGPPPRLADRPWGWPMHYYGGYQTGLRVDWSIQPDKLSLAAALTTGAALAPHQLTDPLKLGLNARLRWQPTYWWEQGFSVSFGHLMKRTARNLELVDLRKYNQGLVGTDFKLGLGYWELSGELMASWQKVPIYLAKEQVFARDEYGAPLSGRLFNLGGYTTIQYEPPFLPGTYVAYQIGALLFGDAPLPSTMKRWDGNALQQQIGLGWKVKRWLLFRSSFSWWQVAKTEGDYWRWDAGWTVWF